MAPLTTIEKKHTAGKALRPVLTSAGLSITESVTSNSPLNGGSYGINHNELTELHDPKCLRKLHEIGGIDDLVHKLGSNLSVGLNEHDEDDVHERIKRFGANMLPTKLQKSFLLLCYEAMKDKVLILLSAAAIISLALGLYETFGSDTEYDAEGRPIPKVDWVEGVAIIVAIIIVVVVGAGNDYQKERQFAKLNAKKEDRELIVIRNGAQKLISIYDILVGDIITLQTGDVIPADCVMISGEVECDESALTGESDTIKKIPAAEALNFYNEHLPTEEDLGSSSIKFKDPYLISGSKVLAGLGNAIVTAVGEHSIHGRTMMSLNEEGETTPLQQRLNDLAEGISKYGFLAALVLFIVLFIRFCVEIAPNGKYHEIASAEKGKKFLDILITSITIVVVAVPEGLPLAVTLALAFATTRMAQNGNLVRVLRSCETMGGATAICSDKTGTLTENRMRIVKGFFGYLNFDDAVGGIGPKAVEVLPNIHEDYKVILSTNITLNSTAFVNTDYNEEKVKASKAKPVQRSFIRRMLEDNKKSEKEKIEDIYASEPFLGNKTESALLILADKVFNLFADKPLDLQRKESAKDIVQVIPFESSRKWSGMVLKINNGYRLYVKGAAETVFKNCGFQYSENGSIIKMDRNIRDVALSKIDEYANDALRAIALGHRDFVDLQSWPPQDLVNPENSKEADPSLLLNISGTQDISRMKLVMDGIVGIQDPLKEGVPEAVLQCQRAGVTVRMITGDNLITAKSISKSCHILTSEDLSNEYAFIEGPEFRNLSEEKRFEIAPNLKVMARSSPEDKRLLVDTLKKLGEVVAVTGDGTNDAPALKLADVGFSMGISGTEVAREASDIILMTDDFTDIVQAIKWGRTVATSIKKFIQFQLTVNITACVLTFVSAVASSSGKSVLTAVQLLWVNLIMDTLAALALATDKPDDSSMNKKPAGRHSPLISTSMWKMIIGQATTQLIVTFILNFAGKQLFIGSRPATEEETEQLAAMTFNAFVWLQFWKLVVTRKLDEADDIRSVRGRITRENLDFFQHLFRNWYFLAIAAIIGGAQVLIMFVGGAAFSIKRQTPGMWATAILCGFISIPVGALLRICPNYWVEAIFPTKAFKSFLYYVGFEFLKKNKNNDLEKNSSNDKSE